MKDSLLLPAAAAGLTTTRDRPVAGVQRPDIEGLRGIAIASVIAFHLVPDTVQGGFVGVDVFFVLSGFLIASIAFRQQAQQGFSAWDFYVRRVRRLLPALLVVLLACLVFAAFWTIPADSKAIGKDVAAGAGFVSNLALWSEAGYFDPSSDLKPLLHLWSLGVEAQFYLLFPLLAWLLVRAGRYTMPLLLVMLCASFGLNVGFVDVKPNAVFFMPFTRLWEMLIGVVLASWSHRVPGGPAASVRDWLPSGSPLRPHVPDLFTAAGLLLLAAAIGLIDETVSFPGGWALLPTLATFLVLAAGMSSWINRHLLALPVLGFFGRISYPLYLWHWPLLTFPVLLNHKLDTLQQLGLLIVAVGLAVLTRHGVEQPLRFGRLAPRAPAFMLAVLFAFGGLGWALFLSDGLLARYPTQVRTIASEHLHRDMDHVRLGTCFQDSAALRQAHLRDCIDREPAKVPLLLLWGDSFAASLYPGLRALVTDGLLPMRLAQFTGPLCPPLPQGSVRQLNGCQAMNEIVLEQVRRERPAMVVLAGSWSTYQPLSDGTTGEVAGLAQTVARLHGLGVARVVVMGTLPVWQKAQPRLLLSLWQRGGEVPSRLADGLSPQPLALDALVAGLARRSGAEFVSVYDLLCNRDGCQTTLLHDGRLHPTAHDEAHLTTTASRHLARAALPQLAQAPPANPMP
ncbi:MAG: acyltransferase family protein [Chitinophagaceae bacterium]|nr:acyltransferase family protein [Rubrivivax sp.]